VSSHRYFPLTTEVIVTSIRNKPGNTGITGGIKGINNKVPTSSTKKSEGTKKPAHPGKFEKTPEHKPGWKPGPNKPLPAR
jgi:hypothetical protein